MKLKLCTEYELIVRNLRTHEEAPVEPHHLAAAGYFPRESCHGGESSAKAKGEMAKLMHAANLHLPDDAQVPMQVGFLRPILHCLNNFIRGH